MPSREIDATDGRILARRRERAPFLVLNHGRPANAAAFAAMPRQRYPANAQYFVAQGFVVFIPTWVGYGPTGGDDVEYSGPCQGKISMIASLRFGSSR
jgi:hypothetical protein